MTFRADRVEWACCSSSLEVNSQTNFFFFEKKRGITKRNYWEVQKISTTSLIFPQHTKEQYSLNAIKSVKADVGIIEMANYYLLPDLNGLNAKRNILMIFRQQFDLCFYKPMPKPKPIVATNQPKCSIRTASISWLDLLQA